MTPERTSTECRSISAKRRGSLLAQMIVVMSCMSILITLSGTLLFRLFRQQANMTQATVQAATWSRLARDFRSDVHSAKSADVTGENGESLELVFENATVTWRADGEIVHRVHRATDSPKTVEETPGERYLCPNGTVVFSVIAREGEKALVELRVTPTDSHKSSSKQNLLRISTALGLERRHEGGATE